MSAWVVGKTYRLFGRDVGLKSITRRNGRPRGRFVGDDGFVTWAYLDTLQPSTDVRVTLGVNASAAVDAYAEAHARLLLGQGSYCISGKHLRIARVADPHVRASFETASMPAETKAERLRRKLASQPSAVEVKTVGVDTYVALKKLRRRQGAARIDAAKLEAANRQLERMGVIDREAYSTRTLKPITGPIGFGPAALAGGPEQRYIRSLEALPDSLYKRTQLRLMSLPKDARRDNSARRKAFDREVRKYLIERLPEEGIMTRTDIVNLVTGERK